jgi:DNA-binding MarR family transcriptional regulator
MSSNELTVLRAVRLKGRASVEDIAAATGLDGAEITSVVGALVESGEAREVGGNYMLLGPGREHLTELLAEERSGVDTGAVQDLYEQFSAVNGDFKQLASDWQLRDGGPNDHSDAAYDQQVLDRLPSIHERVSPVAERAAQLAPRLAPYGPRLSGALERVRTGDHAWLLKPLIDSYHTVWFEFHEELIGLAGLSREAEAASGRAE